MSNYQGSNGAMRLGCLVGIGIVMLTWGYIAGGWAGFCGALTWIIMIGSVVASLMSGSGPIVPCIVSFVGCTFIWYRCVSPEFMAQVCHWMHVGLDVIFQPNLKQALLIYIIPSVSLMLIDWIRKRRG